MVAINVLYNQSDVENSMASFALTQLAVEGKSLSQISIIFISKCSFVFVLL